MAGVPGPVGHRPAQSWLLWDRDADEWFVDAPVLLDFDGEQLEVQHQRFDDLSIPWATADPNELVSLPEFELAWRSGATPDPAGLEPVTGSRASAAVAHDVPSL